MNSEKKCVVLFCINSVEVSEFTAWNVSAFGVTLVLCGSISLIVSVLFDMNSGKTCVVLFCINSLEVSEFTAWNVSAFGVTLVLCGSISVIVSVLFDITLTRHV